MFKFIIIVFTVLLYVLTLCSCSSITEEFPPENSLGLNYKTIREDTVKKYAGYIYRDLFNKCLNEIYISHIDSISLKSFTYQAYVAGYAYYNTEYYDYPDLRVTKNSLEGLNEPIRLQIRIPDNEQFKSQSLNSHQYEKIDDYFGELRNSIFRDVKFSNSGIPSQLYRSSSLFGMAFKRGYENANKSNFLIYDKLKIDYLEESIHLLFEDVNL